MVPFTNSNLEELKKIFFDTDIVNIHRDSKLLKHLI